MAGTGNRAFADGVLAAGAGARLCVALAAAAVVWAAVAWALA
jgi:hypothetical protein